MDDKKRLFFAFDIMAPWGEEPKGEKIALINRHLTLGFLGEVYVDAMKKALKDFPEPFFSVGVSGKFNKLLFLPQDREDVVAYGVNLYQDHIIEYKQLFDEWLSKRRYRIDHRPFLPHVTAARQPFEKGQWQTLFQPLPFITKGIVLYESLGHSHYNTLWRWPLQSPFVEIARTADLAFHIFGQDHNEIYINAATALAFHYPPLVSYILPKECATLEEVIISLNELITDVGTKKEIPFKAVSFHGSMREEDEMFVWDMIVEV